jgi:hypothetical protein
MDRYDNIRDKGFDKNPHNINRNGRPKGSRNRQTIARELLDAVYETEHPLTRDNIKADGGYLATLAQLAKAIKNADTQAYIAIMDSAYGKPRQAIEQTNMNHPGIRVEIVDSNNGAK